MSERLCRCGKTYADDGIWFCPTCQPFRPRIVHRTQANFADGSKREDGSFISERHLNDIKSRKVKKSEETIAQQNGEI